MSIKYSIANLIPGCLDSTLWKHIITESQSQYTSGKRKGRRENNPPTTLWEKAIGYLWKAVSFPRIEGNGTGLGKVSQLCFIPLLYFLKGSLPTTPDITLRTRLFPTATLHREQTGFSETLPINRLWQTQQVRGQKSKVTRNASILIQEEIGYQGTDACQGKYGDFLLSSSFAADTSILTLPALQSFPPLPTWEANILPVIWPSCTRGSPCLYWFYYELLQLSSLLLHCKKQTQGTLVRTAQFRPCECRRTVSSSLLLVIFLLLTNPPSTCRVTLYH